MNHRRIKLSIGLITTAVLTAGGCEPIDILGESADNGAVFIVGTERLSPPAVADSDLYRPAFTFVIDPADPAGQRAAGFYLEIATASPQRLHMRTLYGETAPPAALLRISPPDEDDLASPGGWNLPVEARNALLAGQGVFWPAGDSPADGLTHRFGVALPENNATVSFLLEAFTATTPDGAPMLSDHIELARDFFYMAAIGDSVMWGNGLRENQKFTHLVADEIQKRTGRRVVLQVHAISGARIEPHPNDVICRVWCNGEVQTATTSVTAQVDLLEAPDRLELVLMDGCINDVGVSTILNADSREDALAELTRTVCHDDMLALLRKVRATAPAASIVVTGYYPMISTESNLPELAQFILARGGEDDPSGAGVIADIAEQARVFFETAQPALAEAVQEANAESGDPGRIAFADPGFESHNALFAPESLLWGLTADRVQPQAQNVGLTLFPADPLADLRATGCFGNPLVDPISCLYASVGHPDPQGARRYADVIVSLLVEQGVIPE